MALIFLPLSALLSVCPFLFGCLIPSPLPLLSSTLAQNPGDRMKSLAQQSSLSLGLCSLFPSPSTGHPGPPAHSASLEGPEPVPHHGILGNPKLLRAVGL